MQKFGEEKKKKRSTKQKQFGYSINNYSVLKELCEHDCTAPLLFLILETTMSGLKPFTWTAQKISEELGYTRAAISRTMKKFIDLNWLQKTEEGYLLNWEKCYRPNTLPYETLQATSKRKQKKPPFPAEPVSPALILENHRNQNQKISSPEFSESYSSHAYKSKEEFWEFLSKAPYEPQDIYKIAKEGFYGTPEDKQEFIKINTQVRIPVNSTPSTEEMEFYKKKAENWYEAIRNYEKKLLKDF